MAAQFSPRSFDRQAIRALLLAALLLAGCEFAPTSTQLSLADPALSPRPEGVPALHAKPVPPLSPSEQAHIQALIVSLVSVTPETLGLLPLPYCQCRLSHPALLELVRLGPAALPALLASLSDATPTQCVVRHSGELGVMSFYSELPFNPNSREDEAGPWLSKVGRPEDPVGHVPQYTLTVGDVCKEVVGYITARQYSPVRFQPSCCIIISSPTRDPAVAHAIREIWRSSDPREHLFQSLLADVASDGFLDPHSARAPVHQPDDNADPQGDFRRIQSVANLLKYFSDESAALIAARIDRFDLKAISYADMPAFLAQFQTNQCQAADFLKAVAKCPHPLIRAACQRAFFRTNCADFAIAAAAALDRHDAAAAQHLIEFPTHLQYGESTPRGDEQTLLTALTGFDAPIAQQKLASYARTYDSLRRRSLCWALHSGCYTRAAEVLLPYLDDKRPVDPNMGPCPRVCDEAAIAIAAVQPELTFDSSRVLPVLDTQIEAMKRQLAPKPE